MSAQTEQESFSFQAEVVQILDLMVHSLYSNKEIFLRELISNASDAIDRLRLELLSQSELPDADGPLQIRVSYDAEARTITVADNGIGMSRQEVIEHIGTIAKSGTREFLQALTGDQRKDASLIGQFGVGFYSANLLGPFRCSKAAAPALKAARGAIVNTASIAGTGSGGSSMPYGASKAALVNLTKNLARGLAPEVRVNAVAPGGVDSSWQIEWTPEQRKGSIERSLLKKRADPLEIGDLIVYLGFGATMVTGQTVICDAGLTL